MGFWDFLVSGAAGTVKDVAGAAKDAAEGTANKFVNIQEILDSLDPLTNLGKMGQNDVLLKQLLGQFGLSIEQMSELRETMYDNGMVAASMWGKELKDVIELQVKYNEVTGRSIILGRENYDEQFAINRLIGETGTQYTQAMQHFNQSVESAYSLFGAMYADVESQGLNLKKVSDSVVKNLQVADHITFRDGTAGLMNMSVWAERIKFNMQSIQGIVDKVTSNFESSISMSAKLQVLGGPFAALADPLAMMEEGFNDPEVLATRMASMIGSLATFDSETGEFNLKGMYPQLAIRQYAEQTGISVDDARRSAKEQARRQYIESQLGSDLSQSEKTLISSKAEYDKITQSFYVRNYKGDRVNISDINQSNITSFNSNVAADADPQTRMYTAAMNSQGYMELFGNAAKAMALGQQQLLDDSWVNDLTKFGLEIRDSLGSFATSIKKISDADLSGVEKIKAYFGALNSFGKKLGDSESAQAILKELETLLTGDLGNSKVYEWIKTIAQSFVGSIWKPLMGEINKELKNNESHWGGENGGVQTIINDVKKFLDEVITPFWNGIVKPFTESAAREAVTIAGEAVGGIIKVTLENIPDLVKAFVPVLVGIFKGTWDGLSNLAEQGINWIRENVFSYENDTPGDNSGSPDTDLRDVDNSDFAFNNQGQPIIINSDGTTKSTTITYNEEGDMTNVSSEVAETKLGPSESFLRLNGLLPKEVPDNTTTSMTIPSDINLTINGTVTHVTGDGNLYTGLTPREANNIMHMAYAYEASVRDGQNIV